MERYTDEELIGLWKSGDESAFSALYKRYVLKLMSISISKTPNEDDAEEMVQNTFLKFYQHKDSLNDIKSVFAYLSVILKNQILNYHRTNMVRRKYEQRVLASPDPVDNTLNTLLEIKELKTQIELAISKLPERCREVFLLRRRANMSNKQIADQMNISENTVEQHMRKALSRLKHSLGNYFVFALLFIK